MRVTRNALLAALAAMGSSNQYPMSRYDESPMTSQHMYMSSQPFASTTPSMAAVNSEIAPKYQRKRSSSLM